MRTLTAFLFLLVWMAAAPAMASAQLSAPAEPQAAPEWNPLQANKDIEVGTYYLKTGNYEAAIDRFQEAARLQPGLARPYLKLGETYEKIKDLRKALDSYRKYLELYRSAPDAKKVQKRIEGLERQLAREAARSGAA